MTRQELIQYIKENDSNYSHLTFAGHTDRDLRWIKQQIENEKIKEHQTNDFAKLPAMLLKIFKDK